MFGLTKREQRWKAEQKAAETIAGVLVAAINAKAHKGVEMNKAEQLIACLEGEIAKRDEELAACRVAVENCEVFRARIVELESRYQRDVYGLNNEGDQIGGDPAGGYANDNARLRTELAALKAQEPVGFADITIRSCAKYKSAMHCLPMYAAPVSEAKAQGVRLPPRMWEDQDAESPEFARGHNAAIGYVERLNAAPVQHVSVPDKFCIGAWRDALEKIAKYAPQVNCAARTELERAGLIAVHALIAFSAPQFRHTSGTQTASSAAPAAPAADAGLVEALETIINPIEAMRRELQVGEQLNGMVAMQLASDPEYLRGVARAAIAAHRAKGVV